MIKTNMVCNSKAWPDLSVSGGRIFHIPIPFMNVAFSPISLEEYTIKSVKRKYIVYKMDTKSTKKNLLWRTFQIIYKLACDICSHLKVWVWGYGAGSAYRCERKGLSASGQFINDSHGGNCKATMQYIGVFFLLSLSLPYIFAASLGKRYNDTYIKDNKQLWKDCSKIFAYIKIWCGFIIII